MIDNKFLSNDYKYKVTKWFEGNKFSFYDDRGNQDMYIKVYNEENIAYYLATILLILKNHYRYTISDEDILNYINSYYKFDLLNQIKGKINDNCGKVSCSGSVINSKGDKSYEIILDRDVVIDIRWSAALNKAVFHLTRADEFRICLPFNTVVFRNKDLFLQCINTMIWLCNCISFKDCANYINVLENFDIVTE